MRILSRPVRTPTFNQVGRAWLGRQDLPDDERVASTGICANSIGWGGTLLPRPGDRRGGTRRRFGEAADDHHRRQADGRSQSYGGDGDIHRFFHPRKLMGYFGLNPRVRQSGRGPLIMGASASPDAATRARCWSRRPGRPPRRRARCMPFSCASGRARASDRSRRRRSQAHGALLACADEGTGLPVGASGDCRQQARALELQAGPQKKGNQRGPAYAYNVKALRDQEMTLAQQAERTTHTSSIVGNRPPRVEARERLNPARNE